MAKPWTIDLQALQRIAALNAERAEAERRGDHVKVRALLAEVEAIARASKPRESTEG